MVNSAEYTLSSNHRGISHWDIKMQTDSHRGTAAVVNVRVWGRHVAPILKALCNSWLIFCRAAERRLTSSIQTPKSGVLSAAETTATAVCRWSMEPTCTWSRCLMTRWAHEEECVSAIYFTTKEYCSDDDKDFSVCSRMGRWLTAYGWWKKNTASLPGYEDCLS